MFESDLQAIGGEQKKTEGDNEEVSGVPEQVDWSVLDNVVAELINICLSGIQYLLVCML